MNRITVLKKVLSIFLSTALILSAFTGCSLKKNVPEAGDPNLQSMGYHSEVINYFDYQKIEAPGNVSAIVDFGKSGDDYFISGYSDIKSLMSVNYRTVMVNTATGEVTDCDLSEVGAIQISNIFVSGNGEKLYVSYYDAGYNTVLNVIDAKSGKSGGVINLGKEMLINSLRESDGSIELFGLAANADYSSVPFITYLDREALEIIDSVDVSEKIDLSWAGYTNVVPSKEPSAFYAELMSKDNNKVIKVIKFDSQFNILFESEEILCGDLFQSGLYENKDGNACVVLRSSVENLLCADIVDKNTGKVTRSSDFIPEEDISGLYTFVPETGYDFVYSTLSGIYQYDTDGLRSEKLIDFEENNIPENCRNPYFINVTGNYFIICGQGDAVSGGAEYVFLDEEGKEKEIVPINSDNLYSVSVGKNRSAYYTETSGNGILQLVNTDASGEIKRTDVTTLQNGSLYAGMIRTAKDGSVMLGVTDPETEKSSVLMYNTDFEKIFEADCPAETVIDVIAVRDTMMMICNSGIYLFDINGKKFDKIEVPGFDPENMTALESNDDEFDFYYQSVDGIYGAYLDKNESVEIINWIDSDFNNKINSALVINKDRILVSVPGENAGDDANTFYLLTRADESKLEKVKKKKTIVAGVMNLTGNDSIIDKIIDYNRSSEDFRIVLNDYSKYGYDDKETGNEGGMTVLNNDLKSGNIPDVILAYGDIDFSALNLKNTFADLSAFMKKDSEIHMEDLLENITASYTDDGKMYAVPVKFGIDAIMGSKSVLGEKTGWTYTEFLDFADKNEKVLKMNTLDEIDMSLLSVNLDDFVNFKKKKCSFDKPEFIRLIEMIKKQDTAETDISGTGSYPAKIVGIGDYMSFLYFISDGSYSDPVFKGIPDKKETGANINPQMILAVSERSKNKEQAWEFAKYFLSAEYQDAAFNEAVTFGFPVRKDTFENMMNTEAGKDFSLYGFPVAVDGKKASEQLKTMINGASRHVVSDSGIKKILREALDDFYSGNKSAEETAAIIQTRVTEYLQSL